MAGGLIKGVLRALVAYLELRNKTHYHRVVTESRDKQKKLINEIETLRTAGDVDSNAVFLPYIPSAVAPTAYRS